MEMTDPETVVVVDPDPAVAESLRSIFDGTDTPHEVCHTPTPADVDYDSLDRTDCLVTEYDLPDGDGLTVLETARAAVPEIPVVVYTDAGDEDVASDAIAGGVTDYVSKGVAGHDVLAHRVNNAIAQAQTEARAEQIQRVNRVLQEIDAALVRADSRHEIEQAVCDIVAASDQYLFAWVGEYVPDEHRLLPRAHAGVGESFLDRIPVGTDTTLPDSGPGPKTLETGTVQVSQNIEGDANFEEYQEAADAHGYRSVATVPLVYEETTYGLLAIYADRPFAFDETERALLESLGGDVGHAIHAVEIQAELREFRKAVDHAGHGICITEPGGRIQHVNDAFVAQTGYDREALLGTAFSTIQPAGPEAVIGESESVEDGAYWERELTATRADGSEYHIEQTIAEITDDQGQVQGFVIIQADITERREREVAIRRERETLEAVFDTSPTGIVVLSPSGTIIRANNRADRILGLAEDGLAGRTVDEQLWTFTDTAGEPIPSEEHPFRTVLASRSPVYDRELRMERATGDPIWVRVNGAPLFGPEGGLDRTVFTFEDVTERKENELTLERQNARLEEFASVVSHDLRNPLTVARGSLELLEEGPTVERIADSLDRMEAIIEDVLTLAREGAAAESIEPIDIAAIARESASTVDLSEAAIELVGEPTMMGDPRRTRRIFENLYRNAWEHVGPDVSVVVGPLDSGGFYVADDGPGIDPEARDRIFESGYTTASEGTGLGLSIVKRLAEAQDWTVKVAESEAGGARFEFRPAELS